jgi:hypothetical protein
MTNAAALAPLSPTLLIPCAALSSVPAVVLPDKAEEVQWLGSDMLSDSHRALSSQDHDHMSPVVVPLGPVIAGVGPKPRLLQADGRSEFRMAMSEISVLLELKQLRSLTSGTLLLSSVKMMSAHCKSSVDWFTAGRPVQPGAVGGPPWRLRSWCHSH